MLKFNILFGFLNYFTSLQIRRFKLLCCYMDTIYLFKKIMQYRPPYTPPAPVTALPLPPRTITKPHP